MARSVFDSEDEMQKWLSNQLDNSECFSDLIFNKTTFDEMVCPDSLVEKKLYNSYCNCMESLHLVKVLAKNENISLKNGDILKPDFVLYAQETQSIVIVELKNLTSPSRQVGTEVSAYASEMKSYIPFISDGDIVNVLVSSIWTTLIKHYVFHEIFWLNRNIICLEPFEFDDKIYLRIVDFSSFIDNDISIKLAEEHLGGYQICLYDDNLYSKNPDRNRLDNYVEQMKTAISAMASKGNMQKNHGFAFLWKDNWKLSSAPYSITVLNLAPFQSIERFFHNDKFEPNEMMEKLIGVIEEYDPIGHSFSLEEISKRGTEFLANFCSPRYEGFTNWFTLRDAMIDTGELVSFHGWGIFAELYSNKLLNEYKNGNSSISSTNPELGLSLLEELVDANYEFIRLSNYKYDPSENSQNDFDFGDLPF